MKHTPGPWTLRITKPFSEIEGGQIAIDAPKWSEFITIHQHCCIDPQEGVANARLIIAAPDLLEALKKIRNAFNLSLRTVEDFDLLLKNQLPMIEQTIAKAEG